MLIRIIQILVIIGIIFCIIGVTESYYSCPPNITTYRYIPRTFKEEQDSPIPITEIFNSMFNDPSPWVVGINTIRSKLTGKFVQYDGDFNKSGINNFNISQD